jgi:hypothetical protein
MFSTLKCPSWICPCVPAQKLTRTRVHSAAVKSKAKESEVAVTEEGYTAKALAAK